MNEIHDCIRSEIIQQHGLEIAELEKEVQFKREKINLLQTQFEDMDKKLDKMNDNINKLIQASMKSDANLEKRLVAMETKIAENDKAVQDNRNRFTIILSMVIVFFTALTFIFNFILK